MFTNLICINNKGLVFRIYKEHSQLKIRHTLKIVVYILPQFTNIYKILKNNNKTSNPSKKQVESLIRHLTKEGGAKLGIFFGAMSNQM